MVRFAIAGAVMLVMIAAPAEAGRRENAMQHLGSVYALNALCPKVEANHALIAVLASGVGVDVVAAKDEITAIAMAKMLKLKDNSEEAVCATALFLYGPNGSNVKGLLRAKGE